MAKVACAPIRLATIFSADMSNFHVTLTLTDEQKWRHVFYYGTDSRFEFEHSIIDVVAIHCWCHGLHYNNLMGVDF